MVFVYFAWFIVWFCIDFPRNFRGENWGISMIFVDFVWFIVWFCIDFPWNFNVFPMPLFDKRVAPGTFPRKILAPGLEQSTKTTTKTNKSQEKTINSSFLPSFSIFFISFSWALRPLYVFLHEGPLKPSTSPAKRL